MSAAHLSLAAHKTSQPSERRKYTATDKACFRARESREIAERVENAVASRQIGRAEAGRFSGLGADEAEAFTAASVMRQCAHVENVWHAEGFRSATGESYEAFGTLFACNVRLCTFCMAARRKEARRRAREGWARVRLREREKWFLVTLTMPTLAASRAGLLPSLRVMQDAWRAFTKDGLWQEHSRAGIKGVEFTLGRAHADEGRAWDAERDGYHVHIHLLCAAVWINTAKLRRDWTDCLERAWRANGIEQGINTTDGLAVCHARFVSERKVKRSGSVISAEGAVNEVAKYITKGESFLTIPEDQLIEVAAVRRWPRMFELIGDCRAPATKDKPDVREPGPDYLDTEKLSAAEGALNENRKRHYKQRRPRSECLRSRGVRLFLSGEYEKWDKELAAQVADVRSYRREMIADGQPTATLHTLGSFVTGYRMNVLTNEVETLRASTWYGLKSNPAGFIGADDAQTISKGFEDYTDARRAEIEEGAAVEAYQWETSVIGRDREEFGELADRRDECDRNDWINEPVIRKSRRPVEITLWQGDELVTREVERERQDFDALATNEQRERRKALHDHYNDAEMLKAILFSQNRQAEWYRWILNPGSPAPGVKV